MMEPLQWQRPMIIIFIGIIGSLGFNINSGILQGLGVAALRCCVLIVAAVINIILDLVLPFRLNWV